MFENIFVKKYDRNMPLESFPIVTESQLELLASAPCPCCGDPFGPAMRPDLTGKCHCGPVFVSYWDGWVMLACSTCRKPIMRVRVQSGFIKGGNS